MQIKYLDGTGIKADADMADAAFFLSAEQGYMPAMKIVQKGLMSGTKQQQETLWQTSRLNRESLIAVLAAAKLPE